MRLGLMLFCVFLVVGCTSPAAQKTKPEPVGDVYRFSERPYDAVRGVNRSLYNYIFNVTRNKLLYYVLESDPQATEPLGVVLELDISGSGRGLGERRNAPAIRGWFLFEGDSVPVDEAFLAQYRMRQMLDRYRDMAKASFWVERIRDGQYRVFVRYWVKTAVWEFMHEVSGSGENYTVVRTQAL